MHPPLFKPHPLCKGEVETLVRCHEENPLMKFLNACGEAKIEMDKCFREEKKLRVQLNKRIPNPADSPLWAGPPRSTKSASEARE